MSGPDMSTDTVAKGLGQFLSEQRGRPVVATNLMSSSAGARRGNVLFDAIDGDTTIGLVATIIPSSVDIEINPITAEAAVRDLAEAHGVPVPHIHAVCTDTSYVGGPFFLSTRVDGESVPRRVLRLVHAEDIGELVAGQLGEAFGHLHAIDPSLAPDGLAGGGTQNTAPPPPPPPPRRPAARGGASPETPAPPPRKERGASTAERPPAPPAFAFGARWLERPRPAPPPRHTIVHTDVRNGNIIVNKSGLA